MKHLKSFQLCAAYRMAKDNKLKREGGLGTWKYPPSVVVLEEIGLHPITHYIEVRRQAIASFIMNLLIFDYCVRGVDAWE